MLLDSQPRPSFASQYSSKRPSNATQKDRETGETYPPDYSEEFKWTTEDNASQYPITSLKPVKCTKYKLFDVIDPKPTIQLVAFSASGRRVVFLSDYSFWVFETQYGTEVCSRVSAREKKKTKLFGRKSKAPQVSQYNDCIFHSAALSDKYLAIGANEMIMIFTVEADNDTERPLFCDEFQDKNPERLRFSANGEQLVGVLRDTGQDHTQVLIYSTAAFSEEHSVADVIDENECSSNPSEISWDDSPYLPNDVAFSTDGNMIAICSGGSGFKAEFRILRKFGQSWREFLVQEVELFEKNDKLGWGFTRITLYLSCHD